MAPIHGVRDEWRIGVMRVDCGMKAPSDQRREHNALCHRYLPKRSVMASNQSLRGMVVWSIRYTR